MFQDNAVVSILCEWSVTNIRSGELRAFVAAKLLDLRQSKLMASEDEEKDGQDYTAGTTPPFQYLLFKFFDTEAPHFNSPHHPIFL